MDWLARREYSRIEIEQKLIRRFPDATAAIGPVLDQLEHEGLLSTARYLESVTRSHVRRGYGPQRIRQTLKNKGLGMMSAASTESVDWLAEAREVRRRKFGDNLPAGPVERNRQMAFLLRRGFISDICRKACLPPREE